MNSKKQALEQIISLAKSNDISVKDIATAFGENQSQKSSGNIAMRIFSILGGIFIFAGVCAYIGMFWTEMNSAVRVLITLGSGFVAYFISIVFSREESKKNFVAPLMLFAAMLETSGLFVLIDEYFNNHTNNWRLACLIVFGVMITQQLLTFISMRLPVLLFTTLWFGAWFFLTAFDMLEVPEKQNVLVVGLSLLFIAFSLRHSIYAKVATLANIFGATMFLGSTFALLENSALEPAYLGIVCFMIYISIIEQSTSLLVIGTLAMLSYISYFTAQHFIGSVGWPVALIILGMIFFGIGSGVVRIKKKYISN